MTAIGRRLPAMLAAAAALSTLSGCDLFVSPPQQTAQCEWMGTTDPQDGAAHTVLLVDRSNSTRSADGRGVDYAAQMEGSVQAAVKGRGVVTVGTFDGSASTVRWTAENLATDRQRENDTNRAEDEREAITCLHRQIESAGGVPPQTAGSDILGAIGAARAWLKDVTGDRRIVLATDGLSTVGCADLTRAPVGAPAAIGDIVELCARRPQELPDLSGVALELLGIGHPADTEAQPSTPQLAWLVRLWSELCRNLHARSCEVAGDPVRSTSDGTRTTVPAVADPAVSFPPPEHGYDGPGGQRVFPLDSQVLFDRNSARIRPEGAATLASISRQIVAIAGASVVVDGYTQADGTAEQNLALSQHRAEAVRDVLIGHGVARVSARGHTGTHPMCPPQYRDGKADEQARQCNRRVDIVVTPPDS